VNLIKSSITKPFYDRRDDKMAEYKIKKAKETMTSRERIIKTFNYEKTDRVTIGYEANNLVNRKFMDAMGVDAQALIHAIGWDYIGVSPRYTGKDLFEEVDGCTVNQEHGYRLRWVPNSTGGGYMDYCDFPLKDVEDEVIANYPVPNPDDYDYDSLGAIIKKNRDLAIYIGNPGFGCVINNMGFIMGMEDALCNIYSEHEPTINLIQRRTEQELGILERILKKYKGEIDFMWLGEDLGTQHVPIIDAGSYRKVIKPIHKLFIDLAKEYKIPTLMHTCGSSSWAYEDMIEIGLSGVDTLQPEAVNMEPKFLADNYGGRLNFRGCISTAGVLTYGTAQEVEDVCKETLEIMMPHRGYHFAPTHLLQDNTPIENIVAMYQAAHDYGVYT